MYVCIAYGIGAAVVTKGMTYWSPLVIIAYRMLFGLLTCILIAFYVISTNPSMRSNFKKEVFPPFEDMVHILAQGLTYQAFPQILMAIAQQWVPSTAAQIMQPIAAIVGATVSHFTLHDESFNVFKIVSILMSVTGVSLTVIPSFDHPAPSFGRFKIILGYVLLFFAVSLFGLSSIYFKIKSFKYHQAITSTYQLLSATIFCFISALVCDGYKSFIYQTVCAKKIDWIWPLIVGIFCSALAVHSALYLVKNVGAIGVYFIEIGQVGFGVIIGVVWLREWKDYELYDVYVSVAGIALIAIGVVIGFFEPKRTEYEPIP